MPVAIRSVLVHAFACVLAIGWVGTAGADEGRLVVGSKRFTESYILGEIVKQTAQAQGTVAEHRQGLGNTAVVFEALKAGAIDVYPEYLGTLDAEILKHAKPTDMATMQRELAALGLGVAVPLGFVNGYALALKADLAQRLGLQRISDLRARPELVLGLSHEFIGRADGWPGLAARYRLPQRPVGIDHGIAYEALASGRIAVTDIYSTDAKIAELGLRVLEDDAAYFPRYDAVLLYRLDVARRFPQAWAAIGRLEGRIPAAAMIAMNGEAELRGRPFAEIAQDFVAPARAGSQQRAGLWARLWGEDLGRLAAQHLQLVLVAVLAAALVGVPLGAAAAALPRLEQGVMAAVGLLQTIPSLALFAMLIPLLGRIGTVPALVALSLYALLPIVRNTTTGLAQVSAGLRQAGTALGLTPWQRWRSVDLPLAAPVILAGVKTAAVITVGTATIAAFIGAGGFGERIATGLALNDHAALLAGAIPAAVLALLTQAVFELGERLLRGPGRLGRAGR
ncbi:ABC transporter permease/substrate-binding protein [Ideonella sp. BN130291]|uniref:ABC transporter permease/substrate-binding protein n=1 Tax=Ideonella sp. BN130291 TaxID=3112940 RepID=UPI002E26D50E|nr:glycine betaine ABC transporter substrate-binding protein [Ideonella sp. BN130291]